MRLVISVYREIQFSGKESGWPENIQQVGRTVTCLHEFDFFVIEDHPGFGDRIGSVLKGECNVLDQREILKE